ncbi:alpha/beta hydrolase [Actinocorallia populi]|uniref:alpha/beta hydrolase n=1 Tax=Actinocorallia populi TaxID=2079200 RepID=UPI0013007335|nr:alpha/beta hydrolase [Actinocorallia populi]
MVVSERVWWAGRRVEDLAGAAGNAGVRAWRLLEGEVLVGPAAVALFGRVAERHGEAGRAFVEAAGRIEAAGRQATPPVPGIHVRFPRAGRAPRGEPGIGAGSPEGLNDLMIELGRMARRWQDTGRELRRTLEGIGAGGGPGIRVERLGTDLLGEIPDLRRRRDLLAKEELGPERIGRLAAALSMMWAVKAADPKLYARLLRAGVDPADMPGCGAAEVRKWWELLGREQRRLYVLAFPALIGWADGVPAAARDKANRTVLERRLEQLRESPAGSLTPFEARDLRRLERLADKLASVERDTGQKAYLLGLSSTLAGPWDGPGEKPLLPDSIPRLVTDPTPGPDGRVIIAIGNPDRSRHTGIYVPGTTAQLDNIDGDVERVVNLWKQSQNYVFKDAVSTVMWLGYDAPDGIVADATRDQYADAGAPKLRGFVNGIRAGQDAPKAHVTVIGHSYGSVVVGEAAKKRDFAADDIVVAGSPGMHVGKAAELGIGAERVWAQAAEGDPVPNAGRMGHGRPDPEKRWGFVGNPMPLVPSDDQFGGQILETDTQGHSEYWNEGSKSLDNQVKVMVHTHGNSTPADDPVLKAE